MNKKLFRCIFDVVTFILVFLALQFFALMVCAGIYAATEHTSLQEVIAGVQKGNFASVSVGMVLVSSLLALLLYPRVKWAPVSRTFLNTRPWVILLWVVTLTLGTILPLQFLYEHLQIVMAEEDEALFKGVMSEPLGYAAVGLLVPLAEELVFRGAVLRALLAFVGDRRHWVAIVISALIFGVVHGNMAQGTHAFLLGCLLGWLYYRSGSIVPGVVLHWVNNTVATVLFVLMPQMGDGKLIDFFRGDARTMYLGLACSLCVFIPSLYQLAIRLRRSK